MLPGNTEDRCLKCVWSTSLHTPSSVLNVFFVSKDAVLWMFVLLRESFLQGCCPSWKNKTTWFLLSLPCRMCPSWRPLCSRCVFSSCAAVLWCCVCKHTTRGNVRRQSASSPYDSSALRRQSTGLTSILRPNRLWVFTYAFWDILVFSSWCPVSITLSVKICKNQSKILQQCRVVFWAKSP